MSNSPLSLQQLTDHTALLLQFILHELFEAYNEPDWEKVISQDFRFFPYDWARRAGHLNKAQEHARLLNDEKISHQFEKSLKALHKKNLLHGELKKLIKPLLEMETEDENLFLFLLKNRKTLDAIMGTGYLLKFMKRVHGKSLEMLGEKLCDRYHQRGFFSQIPEFKLLLSELIHG